MSYVFILTVDVMYLNHEKLPLTTLRLKIKRYRRAKRRKAEDAAMTRRTMTTVGRRLDEWVSEGKYRLAYESTDAILRELGLFLRSNKTLST